MHAHVAIAAFPVKLGYNAASRRRRGCVGVVDQMEDVVDAFTLAGIAHRELGAVVRAQDAGIAGLAAAHGGRRPCDRAAPLRRLPR